MHTMHACLCARLNWQFSGGFQAYVISSSSYLFVYRMHEKWIMQPRTPVCRFTSSRVCRCLHGPYYRLRQLLVVFSVRVGRRWWWQTGGWGQRWQWRRPAVSRCWICGSLRSLDDTQRLPARHTTNYCSLRTPALLWFLYHKDWGRRSRLPDVPRANHHDSAPVQFFCSRITVLSITVFSDICLPHVRPICNFAVQQSLRLCRPFYFGLSTNKLGVAYV